VWVRSQDKKDLIDITGKHLTVWENRDGVGIYVDSMTTGDDISIGIGTYETKERAIGVLDEIQPRIATWENSKMMAQAGLMNMEDYMDMISSVYQMPEK